MLQKLYTDYSKNHFRLVPDGYSIEEITHGTNADPNLISVEKVIETINKLKKLVLISFNNYFFGFIY